MKLEIIQENVKNLLKEFPRLRAIENRMEAIWVYYELFEGITETITEKQWLTLTNPETISRAIRKEVNPYLIKKGKKKKEQMSVKFANFYKSKESSKDYEERNASKKEI